MEPHTHYQSTTAYTPAQAERYRRAVSNNRRPAVVTEREALDAFMTICQFFRE